MQGSDEVGREHETSLQDSHDENVGTDLGADISSYLVDPRRDFHLTEQNVDSIGGCAQPGNFLKLKGRFTSVWKPVNLPLSRRT